MSVDVDILIELGEWQLCRDSLYATYAWHKDCEELPEDERDDPQASWMKADMQLMCILCEADLPAEIHALYLLYKVM
jgi:hypothetical protein